MTTECLNRADASERGKSRRSNRPPLRRRASTASPKSIDTGAETAQEWRNAPLHLAWCDHAAAEFAVQNWHYSGRMPVGRLVRVGVWEFGRFVGVVLFGRGACAQIGDPYQLSQRRVCELVRVALGEHVTPVSRVIAIALRMLRRHCPGLRLVVSYADSAQGHRGGIYQAGNWLYVGTAKSHGYRVLGKMEHGRTLGMRYGIGGQSVTWLRAHVDPRAKRVTLPPKHKYLMPLDDGLRGRLSATAQQYPRAGSDLVTRPPSRRKRAVQSRPRRFQRSAVRR